MEADAPDEQPRDDVTPTRHRGDSADAQAEDEEESACQQGVRKLQDQPDNKGGEEARNLPDGLQGTDLERVEV